MQSYLDRYIEGQHIAVWAELVGLGPAVRDEPTYSEALAVAREMMTRSVHNIRLIVDRLNTLGYRFLDPDAVWQTPDPERISSLASLEHRYGPFPLVLRMWCELVGSVNLMGAHPKLSSHPERDWDGS